MCGISGMVDLRGQGRADGGVVRRMTDSIRHRGPDGDGFFTAPHAALGMRRLSIIDVAGSDQPLTNEDGTLTLVFNGEIYNYPELRQRLSAAGHHLRTAGDGETILHLYEDCGLDLFAHLRGMYAFALWDAPRERLVLAVDHIGMKPLYLHERDGQLYFASEVRALLAAGAPRALHLDALDTYLSFGYMIGEETLFAGVRRLMPGHALVAERGGTRLHQHWAFGAAQAAEPPMPVAEADIVAAARALLEETVRIHLRSDVPLGLFLSGGVDSAAVLALMTREAGGRVQTYTVGYAGETPDNELAQAERTAAHFGAQHAARVITADDWWAALPRYVAHVDEPVANSSAVAQMLLAEETARHVKVVLTGLGGDEAFGGYAHHRAIPWLLRQGHAWRAASWFERPLRALEPWYPRFKTRRYIGALPTYLPRLRHALLPRTEGLRRMISYDGMVMTDALRQRLYAPELRQAWSAARHKERTFAAIAAESQRDEPAHTAQALIINTWLHGNALLYCDKVTMAHSLEARVPFFDPALLAFAARLPADLLTRGSKAVLRAAMRPYLPDFALDRPKQPFSTPIRAWFDGPLKPRIADVLLDRGARARQYFAPGAYDALIDAHLADRAKHEELVLRLLLLELWLQAG